VINEDIVRPNTGFGIHLHRDMEILTYILDGVLCHQDSMGNSEEIRAGVVQVMSAGTGVTHNEVNASATQAVHLLQIWIMPAQQNLKPGYQQKIFTESAKHDRWCLLASSDQENGSLLIHQGVRVSTVLLHGEKSLDYPIAAKHKIDLHIARGIVSANGQTLSAGDALMFSDEMQVRLEAGRNAEVLLFDMV
jgi:redox-sensitive bicupin YhaK (pirin superfamily)